MFNIQYLIFNIIINFIIIYIYIYRPLLFKNTELLSDPFQTAHIPPTILIHHLFTRAPEALMLPHQRFGWTGQHYSEWMDSHTETELMELLQKCLEAYVEDLKSNSKEGQEDGKESLCEEYELLTKLIKKYYQNQNQKN